MQAVRYASLDEVKAFHERGGEVVPGSRVLAFPSENGEETDFAIIRPVVEMDVAFAPTSNTKRRALFIHEIETFLRLSGVERYYFEAPSTDLNWIAAVEKWGAERVWNGAPMYRYRKVL